MSAEPSGEWEALLRDSISAFAEALSTTPADQLAQRQPPSYGRRKPKPRFRRDVLVEAIVAAGDLLTMTERASSPGSGGRDV